MTEEQWRHRHIELEHQAMHIRKELEDIKKGEGTNRFAIEDDY